MGKKAVVAGHICIDFTPVFPAGSGPVKKVSELLKPGQLIQMEAPRISTGGAVANTGMGMKLLGADVRLLGKVGEDDFGRMAADILNHCGLGEDLLVDPASATSYSVVLAIPGLDRIFLHCPGANDSFVADDIPDSALEGVSLFHFGYPSIMREMYLHGGEELKKLFARVRDKGLITSLDLAAVDPDSEAGRADWKEILSGVLPYVDVFCPSFEELLFMLDRDKYRVLQDRAGDGDMTEILDLTEDIQPLADACLALGARCVLLKCGAPGLYFKASGQMEALEKVLGIRADRWQNFSAFEESFQIDHVCSATGAGDISIAAFLTSLLDGADPEEALSNAAGAGALCCQAYDPVSGLIPLREIRRRIEAGWTKRKKSVVVLHGKRGNRHVGESE